MITNKQLKIFEVFAKRPFEEHTRTEIKKETKEKSNNALTTALNQLIKEQIILQKKIGRTGLLTLNLDNDLTFQYINICNNLKIQQHVKIALESIKKEITTETPFYSIVIFGSYATGQQKKNSDLDIAIFIEQEDKKKKIETLLNSAKLKSTLEMDIQVISKTEMIEMLSNQEENLGKQIAKKHLSIYNIPIFYELIKEGMKHGFRI